MLAPRTAPPRLADKSRSIFGTDSLPVIDKPSTSVPRRYEESKQVCLQECTHRRILDFGQMFHKQTLYKALAEKDEAVEGACKKIAEEAEGKRVKAVEAAVKGLRQEHEKEIKLLHRKYRKEIKEEIPKVEARMQAEADERVLAERKAGDRRLTLAVKETKEGFAADKLAAVEQARQEQIDIAAENYQRIRDDAAKKLAGIVIDAAKEKEEAILTVKLEKDQECKAAVKKAIDIGKQNVMIVVQERENDQIASSKKLEWVIQQHEEEIKQLHRQIELSMAKRQALFNELQLLRTDYKAFVDRHKIFNDPGQSEYMVPQYYLQHFDEP